VRRLRHAQSLSLRAAAIPDVVIPSGSVWHFDWGAISVVGTKNLLGK
jgi:hypothetical protein